MTLLPKPVEEILQCIVARVGIPSLGWARVFCTFLIRACVAAPAIANPACIAAAGCLGAVIGLIISCFVDP